MGIPFLTQIWNCAILQVDKDPEMGITGTPLPLSAFISKPDEATVCTLAKLVSKIPPDGMDPPWQPVQLLLSKGAIVPL